MPAIGRLLRFAKGRFGSIELSDDPPLRPIEVTQRWDGALTNTVRSTPLEVPSPSLTDEVLSEALYRFLFDKLKTCFLV